MVSGVIIISVIITTTQKGHPNMIVNVDLVAQLIYTCYNNDILDLHMLSQQYTRFTAAPSKR